MSAKRFILNETSYHGHGAISAIITEVNARGFKKALIVTDADLVRFGVVSKVTALLDAEGNILYVQDKSFYDCSIVPGDSLIVRLDIESDFMEYFAANNLVPASVDAIAFVEVETSDW